MKSKINTPAASKINMVAIATFGIGLAIQAGVIPEEMRATLVQFATLAAPPLIFVFRTWFTEPK